MIVDQLIKGHPYSYSSTDGNRYPVLYHGLIKRDNGSSAYNFVFRRDIKAGFVNLTSLQVEQLISN